jgi:hypothetical protein
MRECVNCQNLLNASRLVCSACGLAFEGSFRTSRLARLQADQQEFVEQMILAAGNLKEVALAFDVSYPTLRKRLDALITSLRTLRDEDQKTVADLLRAVEAGDMTADTAMRLIRELNGQS